MKFVIRNSTAEFLTFIAEGKEDGIQVLYKDETIWATQKAMAELFDVDRTVITKHLKNIFDSSELQQNSVCAKFAHTADDRKTYNTTFYKKVQNKMHYAVHGHTAAELIVERADASKEHMGLTTWENAPDGKIVKPEVMLCWTMPDALQLSSPSNSPNLSLRSIVSFRTRTFLPTSTDLSVTVLYRSILCRRTS